MENSGLNKRPVRICVIATVPISIIAFYGKQIEFLKRGGFEITIITSPDDKMLEAIPRTANVICVPMTRRISPFKDLVALFKIFFVIRRGKFDIAQYSSPKAALLGSLVSWFCCVPVRLYLMWGLYYTGQKGLKRSLLKFIEKIICFCSTDVAPDSRGNLDFAVQEKLCPLLKLSLVGKGSANGVDLTRFDPDRLRPIGLKIRQDLKIPSCSPVLGFVGRLRRDKGINELILAFSGLIVKYPELYLLLVGPQESGGEEFDGQAREALLKNKHIIYVGFQEKPEEFISAMDIFVLPSYREGFGIVNVEASAMGLPVISTDIPGPRDSVVNGETGILVKVRSEQELAEAIEKLMGDPGLRKKMGDAGRGWSVNFDQSCHWQAIKEHRLNLLRKANIDV